MKQLYFLPILALPLALLLARHSLPAKPSDTAASMSFRPLTDECGIDITGIPAGRLCPGQCFILQIGLPDAPDSAEHRIAVYSDHPGLPGAAVTANGSPAHPQALLCESYLPPQATAVGQAGMSLEICIHEDAAAPVQIVLYYHRADSGCETAPCAASCCHDLQPFFVDLVDLSGLAGLEMAIKAPYPLAGSPLQTVFSGQPAHFSLPGLPIGARLEAWQYSEGGGWLDIPSFPTGAIAFAVPPGHPVLSLDCANSSSGYIDRRFRAVFSAEGPAGEACLFFTPDYLLRVCCELSVGPGGLSVAIAPDSSLCEGDAAFFEVSLSSPDLFVQLPDGELSIEWRLNGENIGFAGQTSFSFAVAEAEAGQLCFQAIVTHCAGQAQAERCVAVGRKPVCGLIYGDSPNLTLLAEDPLTGDREYLLCPGRDAVLASMGFSSATCLINWEHSPDGEEWAEIGSMSNTIQNTNTLFPPGFGQVYYRARCLPENSPSCEPCFSNIVTIREAASISAPLIDLPAQVCAGTPFTLQVAEPMPGLGYTWYADGLPIGTGASLAWIPKSSECYWVEASNGCAQLASELSCTLACQFLAAITCPLPPNECASLGQPITLVGVFLSNDCPPIDPAFEWSWKDANGVLQISSAPFIVDIPPPEGTLYTLYITDLASGCVSNANLRVVPCDEN